MNQRTNNATNSDASKKKAYLVGGGIASLASAAYLIREGHLLGEHIHIYEESGKTGGSLDAGGSPETGYVMRGGRMFDEEKNTVRAGMLMSISSRAMDRPVGMYPR